MISSGSRLISIDGIDAHALKEVARNLAQTHRRYRAGISSWGASGIFDELTIADPEAGTPSARTLILLYAADLAFRLRWEIRPALEEGRLVIAAPYVATAVALGQAAGIDAAWLDDLFQFAPPATEQHVSDPAVGKQIGDGHPGLGKRIADRDPGVGKRIADRDPGVGKRIADRDPGVDRRIADREGFVEFAWQRLDTRLGGVTRAQLMDRIRRHLRATTRRGGSSLRSTPKRA